MTNRLFPIHLLQFRQQNIIFFIKFIFFSIAILLGFVQAWVNRYKFFSGDIIAYLDMGEAYLRGDWSVAIHGYFSPLYPWILTFFRVVLKPSMYWEIFTVKFVNFILYIFSLVSFEFFLREFLHSYRQTTSQKLGNPIYLIPEWAWLILGYLLFLWSALVWIGVNADTPDMLVAGIVYLATALVLRVHTRSDNGWNFFLLGVILGLGYLAKTFMFFMGFVFLICCFLSVKNPQKFLSRLVLASLVFSLITSPFILALSTQKGYLTLGDNGKLNYAWHFNDIIPRYWQGEPPESGTPKHLPRKLFENPAIYEFAREFPQSTLPIGYDTSYWFEGLVTHFNFLNQVKVSVSNFWFYYEQFGGVLLFIYLILLCVSGRIRRCLKDLAGHWRLIIPAFAALGIYLLVADLPRAQPSMRYIAPFVVLLFIGFLSSIKLPNIKESKRLILGITIGTLLLMGGYSPHIWKHPGEPIYWKVAQGLYQLGIKSRDEVAVIQLGGRSGTTEYWAKLGKLKIVAEVPDVQSFWRADAATRGKIYQLLEGTGAKGIVQKQAVNTRDFMSANGWQKVGTTDYYVYLFKK